ncbi:hypothetical protein [Cellulomonas fengjieae]|uniref:DUF4429 domain-containing protein n=1 Tax=Cellulomonas fengjieae TaxID=2819978 RepID=A0ABS3SMS0_9CELL|nr:hypothetical protein [Cellulomonas fengjieae]MBO3086629.1 hypothetical protein [Cellulomonas fengjieae]QVI66522.1 hypothetical protein KG102_02630 [Cellulomonas fengjieae]
MAWAGGGTDEYKVEAGGLNQTFVGIAFGVNGSGGTVTYGRLAGFHIGPREVKLWLDGVDGDAGVLDVSPDTEVWFSRYTPPAQVSAALERIEKLLDPEKSR